MDYLWPCLAFVWVAYLWDTYLQWRQRMVYQNVTKVPAELQELIDDSTFTKSRHYQLDKSSYNLAFNLFKQIEFLVLLAVGVFPLSWDAAGAVTSWLGLGPEYEISQSMVYIELLVLYSTLIGLPWRIYSTFVLEERHGFNKQTAAFFTKDSVKSLALQLAIIPLIASGLLYIIHSGGRAFYIYAWLFLAAVTLLWVTIYHDYIAPLFDKYTALPEGPLHSAIEQLAQSLSFPLKKIQVVEGSKRSAHSNAYFYGFWKNKRIVLFDTLLEPGVLGEDEETEKNGEGEKEGMKKCEMEEKEKGEAEEVKDDGEEKEKEEVGEGDTGESEPQEEEEEEGGGDEKEEEEKPEAEEGGGDEKEEEEKPKAEGGGGDEKEVEEKPEKEKQGRKGCSEEEVLAVLGHELGHWNMSHNLKLLGIYQVNILFSLVMFGFFMEQQDVFTSFGFPSSRPTLIGLILIFELIFIPYNELMQFLMVQLIRRFEYQADGFAKHLKRGAALHSALTKLSKDNLSFPIADPLYSAFHLTHPTYLERIRRLAKED